MSQGLKVYKDDKKKYMKRIFLPFGAEKEKREFKTVNPATYILISTDRYGCSYRKYCNGCIFSEGDEHYDGCGTLCISDGKQIEIDGNVWKWNEKLSEFSSYNIYEQCKPEDVQYMMEVLNFPIPCTKIGLGKQVYLCNEDGSFYKDTTEIELCENGKSIKAKEGYVLYPVSDVFGTSVVVLKCV